MKCTCGHVIHKTELDHKLYKDRDTGKFVVKWTCSVCHSGGQAAYGYNDVFIPDAFHENGSVIRGFIINKFFVSDIDRHTELMKFIEMGLITDAEYAKVCKELESGTNLLKKLQRIGK